MSGIIKSSTSPTKRELVSRGLLFGQDNITVSGVNPNINKNNVPQTVWNLPGQDIYNFSVDDTAPINTISSSSANDTQTLVIIGLADNGNEVKQFVTLQGQNKVTLVTPLGRHNIMSNESSAGLEGNVYLYEDTNITNGVPGDLDFVRGYIAIGDNVSKQGIYTVPNGKIILLSSIYPMLSKQQDADVSLQFETKRFGKAKQSTIPVGINSAGTSFLPVILDPPRKLRGRTDFITTVVDASDVTSSVSILITFDIIDQIA